jgi:hypothetical protein
MEAALKERDYWYLQWLGGYMQTGTATDHSTLKRMDSGNPVRDAYYRDEPPPFINDVYGYRKKCGTLQNPVY